MSLPTLPLNSLPKEDLYSFLGGLFVGASWYVHIDQLAIFNVNNDISRASLILFLWLLGTAGIYVVQLVFFEGLSKLIASWVNSAEQAKRILNTPSFSFYSDWFKDDLTHCNVLSILSGALILSMHSLSWLIPKFCIITSDGIYIFCMLAVIASSAMFAYFWRKKSAFDFLYRNGQAWLIDRKVYDESMAKYFAEDMRTSQLEKREADRQG